MTLLLRDTDSLGTLPDAYERQKRALLRDALSEDPIIAATARMVLRHTCGLVRWYTKGRGWVIGEGHEPQTVS